MRLVNQVIEDINKAKKINLILTGGNSPLKFYDKLFRSKVNWKKVNLFMTDERAVNIKSKNSNYKKINSILSKNNLSEKLKPLEMKSSKSKNVSNTSKSLKKFKTICFLAIGDDGHFASIFVKSKKYKQLVNLKRKPNILITEKIGKPFIKRITMNLKMLNLSTKIYLILDNKKKIRIFKNILNSKNNNLYSILTLLNLAKNKISIFDGYSINNLKKFSELNNV